MSKTVHAIINTLFASDGRSQPVTFTWRLIRRRGRPFMLLPGGMTEARTGLKLYSAQRLPAKLFRKVLPTLLQTPLAGLFERIQVQTDAASEFMQFMAQQAGVSSDRAYPAAIKLSEVGSRSRLVMLLCDESGRPFRVVKVGLNPAGWKVADFEADFLEQLPPGKLGCVRVTGRLSTPNFSAFSTDYFPGISPYDDAGLEHLFHTWINPDDSVSLDTLPIWCELSGAVADPNLEAWQRINSALAGKTIRTTLYHGDFTPWNVRVVNSRNLQAFDWERGSRHGIPGWDWFHFTIQTAILARRHSAARAAAEVEQLVHSPRFKKYAAAAGISDSVQPLVLAYLLHHIWVIQPAEGGRITAELFDLLVTHWLVKPTPAPVAAPVALVKSPAPGWWASARRQLNAAAHQWSNLFWEPSLNFSTPASWGREFEAHWPMVLITGGFLSSIAATQYHFSTHFMFLPFYVLACALLTWRAGRRWGAISATLAAGLGPLVIGIREVDFREPDVILWNTVMRFIILQMFVLFVDRINKQREIIHHRPPPDSKPVNLADNWAVLLACGLFLLVVVMLDYFTNPHWIFLPIYLLPCMMLALVFNLRWGIIAVLLATSAGTWIEYLANKLDISTAIEVFGWNFLMRLVVSLTVLILLDRIRKENILFFHRQPNNA